jgi:hypothetical protein
MKTFIINMLCLTGLSAWLCDTTPKAIERYISSPSKPIVQEANNNNEAVVLWLLIFNVL